MKVAFVFPPMWPPHVDGSLQIWNREVISRLSRSCDVTVYSGIFDLAPQEQAGRVAYRRFSTHWDSRLLKYSMLLRKLLNIPRPAFSSDLWYPGYALRVALDLRKHGCDIAHVYNYPQFAALIKFLNPSVRIILNMHGELLTQVNFTNLDQRLRKIDSVVCCSTFVARPVRIKFPEIAKRCKTVPMAVSLDIFKRGNRILASNARRRRLLYVGRISPEKGIHVLLDAFDLLLRKYPDATLDIIGAEWVLPREYLADLCFTPDVIDSLVPFYEGSYVQQLKGRLRSEVRAQVNFAGLVSHSDLPERYAAADVYINPSFYESFGMSIIEALAAGLPVVATNVGAVPDLLSESRSGLLVRPSDASAIAGAVSTVFESAELRKSLASAGREMVCRSFSYETICAELVQIYRDAMNSTSRPMTSDSMFESSRA